MSNTVLSGSIARNFGGSWTHRRRIIYGTLVFCAGCILWILLFSTQDNKVQETIVNSAFFLAGGVIGSYVFGAVWEDKKPAVSDSKAPESTTASSGAVTGTGSVDDPDKT